MTTALESGIDIFLHPGEWYFGDRHTRIYTTLGSCIAIALWHPQLKLGAMCHYMLPGDAHPHPDEALNARYGEDAMRLMVAEIRRLKTRPGDYEAKLFGGASMFDVGPGGSSVARRNIQAAESLMQRYDLRTVARSLGGCGYRQLVFNIATGDVWVRQGDGKMANGSGEVA
jgi:chemotaxis protein CheD